MEKLENIQNNFCSDHLCGAKEVRNFVWGNYIFPILIGGKYKYRYRRISQTTSVQMWSSHCSSGEEKEPTFVSGTFIVFFKNSVNPKGWRRGSLKFCPPKVVWAFFSIFVGYPFSNLRNFSIQNWWVLSPRCGRIAPHLARTKVV